MSDNETERDKKLYQVIINYFETDKDLYDLKKLLYDTLKIDIETSQKMIDRGPFVIGKFDSIEAEHWVKILTKLNANIKLLEADNCPLHNENKCNEICSLCGTNVCEKCKKKHGLKTICELCAVDHEIDQIRNKPNSVPLLLLILAFVLVALFFVINRKDPEKKHEIPATSQIHEEPANNDYVYDHHEDLHITQNGIEVPDIQPKPGDQDDQGLIFDQDMAVTDLGQIGFVVYRKIRGDREPAEFFTEKDRSFYISILLEIANIKNNFIVSFIGPDGDLIKTVNRTSDIGQKDIEFELTTNDIRKKYNNEFIFATFYAHVKMNDRALGTIPLFYQPSEDYLRADLPGVPKLREISSNELEVFSRQTDGPWVVIFYRREHQSSLRLLQTARILALNPGFPINFFMMEADRNRDVINQFNISDLPATAVLIGNRVINIMYGFTNSDDFVQSILIALERFDSITN